MTIREDESESIAEAYEEEAALSPQPVDLNDLAVKVRKLEERLATIQDYLGSPATNEETLEERLQRLESRELRP